MELKALTKRAESIDNSDITENLDTETIQEDKQNDIEKDNNLYTDDKINYFKNGDFNIKHDDTLDFIDLPTTSPTIDKDKIKDTDGNDIEYIDDDNELEDVEYEDEKTDSKKTNDNLKDATEKQAEEKKKVLYEVSASDLEFVCYLFVSALDWIFSKGMKMAGYEAATNEDQRKRLISVYSKGLAYYNIKLSPIWAMIIITIIIYGGASMKAKKIDESKEIKEVVKETKKETKKEVYVKEKEPDEVKETTIEKDLKTDTRKSGIANFI